jgi:hypothetical protein
MKTDGNIVVAVDNKLVTMEKKPVAAGNIVITNLKEGGNSNMETGTKWKH